MRTRSVVIGLGLLAAGCATAVAVRLRDGSGLKHEQGAGDDGSRNDAASGAPAGPPCAGVFPRTPPVASYRTPLPDDPFLAAWTAQIESALDDYMRLAILVGDDGRKALPTDPRVQCVVSLVRSIDAKLSSGSSSKSRMRDTSGYLARRMWPAAGAVLGEPSASPHVSEATPKPEAAPKLESPFQERLDKRTTDTGSRDEDVCASTEKFLEGFPKNARLHRALLLQFRGCVEDNFNSFDGPLDVQEAFFRATAEAVPNRLALTLDYFAGAMRGPAGYGSIWDRQAFGRIPIDRGPTGNALVVVGEAVRKNPTERASMLDAIRANAAVDTLKSRRARWQGLAAYVEAGAPDVDRTKPKEIARAIDSGGARWALGLLPIELEEHAPLHLPKVDDPTLVASIERFAKTATDATDLALLLDAISGAAPGTAVEAVARAASTEGAVEASLETIRRWERAQRNPAATKATMAPVLPALRGALASTSCTSEPALRALAAAGAPTLDEDMAACLAKAPKLDTSFLQSLFVLCTSRREFGWSKTGAALIAHPSPGEPADYARRVGNGCLTGRD